MTRTLAEATPGSAGWELLNVRIVALEPGATFTLASNTHESALVVVTGEIDYQVGELSGTIRRDDVFSELAELIYAPPSATVTVTATFATEMAIGQAPAVGRFPARIIATDEMTGLIRGGGPARRQVMSTLADPLPAERLIVYEGWVPRGAWTGWPPHRHDGVSGSPSLEETYYFRFDRPSGFGFHRNYAPENDWEDVHLLRDRSLVAVPRGYHLCANGPAANMWLLNFLAGPPEHRALPPYLDPKRSGSATTGRPAP